ncbi:MAG: radical SAM protein [Promethearchaeota archaeon]
MASNVIKVDKTSGIPLFGVDFIGIIDRGTNIIEIKPITLCNLKCKYCFVNSGNYETNFILELRYLIEKIKEVIEIKGNYDLEIHLAPYGEILLYNEIFELIQSLWTLSGVKIISMQSNGLLLNTEIIKKLEQVNLTRINISLNTLNRDMANYLCNITNYNMETLIQNINLLLDSNIDVLLAPVWFPGQNDKDIEDIINFTIKKRNEGYSEKNIMLGIQKYLIYNTGRKLKKIRPKSWGYFYKQLSSLETKYQIKLKMGPNDFGIHKRKAVFSTRFKKGDLIKISVVSKGRWKNECIGKLDENQGIKVLLKKPLTFSDNLIGKELTVRILKANYKDNIITAHYPK